MELHTGCESLNRRRHYLVIVVTILLGVSFVIFLLTGYTALYWAWMRSDLQAALPYLPWARNSGMLAMACAAAVFAFLFAPRAFPFPPETRLKLSLLAAITVGFFSEFRNEGKFYFKTAVHFFGPGTWAREKLNQIIPSLGDFFYQLEYSHWNDFLMGPAIVCVLYPFVFLRLYKAVANPSTSISLKESLRETSPEQEQALRFARIIMCVGLFWFFLDAIAEKAGYVSNPHSRDQFDFPAESAGTMLGYWMARILTRPFQGSSEVFRSTLAIDLIASGAIGLLYTLIVTTLTENVAGTIAHSIAPDIPGSLKLSEYTQLQQRLRPIELFALGAALWWCLNHTLRGGIVPLPGSSEVEPEVESKWRVPKTIALSVGVAGACLLLWATVIMLLDQIGYEQPVVTAAAGIGFGFAALLLARRFWRNKPITVFGETSGE